MALQMPSPGDEYRQALQAGAALFTGNNANLSRLLAAAPIGLRLLTLTLDDIEQGKLKPQSAGWRFLASNDDGVFISGEVSPTKQGLKLASVSRDPDAAKPFYVAKQLEDSIKVQGKNFTVSVLRIPGILLEALWLESETDQEVLIVPVTTPTKQTLRLRIPSESTEFLKTIQPIASQFRRFDNFRQKPKDDTSH
jgi:hypothetical protein